jgi:membrane protease YdiL (CAAX protease family)
MVLPYLVCSLGTGAFQWSGAVRLAALAVVLAWWFVVLPASALADVAYLCLLAAVKLGHYLDPVYNSPVRVDVDILGFLAMIHVSAIAFLAQRRVPGVGFGFWPTRKEWQIGAVYFLLFLPVGLPLALGLGAFRLGPVAPWWKIAGTFIGVLWVVALAEEFLFRGLLQQWMERWTGSAAAALAAASIAFGLVHLPYRAFPNWKMAIVAAVAGCFYGLAYRRAGSIRAGMVTHALMVSLWRGMFV